MFDISWSFNWGVRIYTFRWTTPCLTTQGRGEIMVGAESKRQPLQKRSLPGWYL